MHPAAKLQFERMIGEFVRWRGVPEDTRSPAPAWWWGPAMELRNIPETKKEFAKLTEPELKKWAAELHADHTWHGVEDYTA